MSKTRLTALALVLAAGAAPHVLASESTVAQGPDMRILPTPEEVLFRVSIDGDRDRLRPHAVEGAMGWSVRLSGNGTGGQPWPTPATDGERVFVGGPLSSNDFYAFRAEDGRLAWKTRLSDNGPTPAVVRDRRVYFNTQSCTLYAYDTRSGTRKWSRYLAGTLESIPAVDGERIVSARPARHERSSRADGGIPALTFLGLNGRIEANVTIDSDALGAPVLHGGRAYVATKAGSLHCVDIAEGREEWRRECRARGAPWVDDTGVYVATRDALEAFHPSTGVARWSEAAITPSSRTRQAPTTVAPPPLRRSLADAARSDAFWGEGLRPVATGDRLCIAEGRTLRFFDRMTGAETAWWELDVAGTFAGAPLVTGDTVVVATREGEIRGVDVRHGEIVWAVDLDRRLGSGVIVDGGVVYAVTEDGHLVAVHTGDLRADGWPMWGGTPTHAAGSTASDAQ